jgi:hypothetical protein
MKWVSQDDAVAAARRFADEEMEERPEIVICRDIPGDHVGGPDCFCIPGRFSIFDDVGIADFLRNQYRVS